LDYGRLLAKIVISLEAVLAPIQLQHDAGHSASQFDSTSTLDAIGNFDGLVSANHQHVHGQASQMPQRDQNPVGLSPSIQYGFQMPPVQLFHNMNTAYVQTPKASFSKRRTATPQTTCHRAGITDRRFAGRILCFDRAKNFGFIMCSDLRGVFDKDIWVHKEQLHGFVVGQLVTFTVVINKHGHPQAVNLLPLASMESDQTLCFSV